MFILPAGIVHLDLKRPILRNRIQRPLVQPLAPLQDMALALYRQPMVSTLRFDSAIRLGWIMAWGCSFLSFEYLGTSLTLSFVPCFLPSRPYARIFIEPRVHLNVQISNTEPFWYSEKWFEVLLCSHFENCSEEKSQAISCSWLNLVYSGVLHPSQRMIWTR